MFCTACGTAIPANQPVCPRCGQPVTQTFPGGPGFSFELARYRSHIRVLAIVWFVYGAFSLLLGIAGLSMARLFLSGRLEPWMHGVNAPQLPPGFLPMMMHLAWIAVAVRAALAFLAGWGLMEQERWGRILAIIVAILSLIRFPLGTALGIWTLIMMFGYRHTTLYELQ